MASGHRQVSEAATEVLRAGGNAFDAAIAGGFASAVAEPALTSIGGGGFLLARPASGSPVLFDFFVDTPGRGLSGDLEPQLEPVTVRFPGSEQEFHVGPGSAAVPGNLRGFLYVHERLGSLPLAEVLAPAIALARDGLELNEHQGYFLGLLEPIETRSPEGRALYLRDGRYLVPGDHYANPELGDFLATLVRDGDRELYEGGLARAIARDMREAGGLLTEEDLRAYQPIERAPLRAVYRGHELYSNPPPSFGGSLLALSLELFERGAPPDLGFGDARHLVALLDVMREVDRRRAEDPRRASGGTTHLSVCDAAGNVAIMTTSNGEGSGYFAPGTGIMLNNMMGEDDLHPEGFHQSPPGVRVPSMMAPSLLVNEGRLELALGSGGSKRIRTALLQAISNVVDFGMDTEHAVRAPRLHWDGETAQVEPGFVSDAVAALRAHAPVNVWDVLDLYFGGVNAVASDGGCAADPRRGGWATRTVS